VSAYGTGQLFGYLIVLAIIGGIGWEIAKKIRDRGE
jgi:hypothetical protein